MSQEDVDNQHSDNQREFYSRDRHKNKQLIPDENAGERYSESVGESADRPTPPPILSSRSLQQASLRISVDTSDKGGITPLTDASPTLQRTHPPRRASILLVIGVVALLLFAALFTYYHQTQRGTSLNTAASQAITQASTKNHQNATSVAATQSVVSTAIVATQAAASTAVAGALVQPYHITVPGACNDNTHWTDQPVDPAHPDQSLSCQANQLQMNAINHFLYQNNPQPSITFGFDSVVPLQKYTVTMDVTTIQSQTDARYADHTEACVTMNLDSGYTSDFCNDSNWSIAGPGNGQSYAGGPQFITLHTMTLKAVVDSQHVSFYFNGMLYEALPNSDNFTTRSITFGLSVMPNGMRSLTTNFTTTASADFSNFTYTPQN